MRLQERMAARPDLRLLTLSEEHRKSLPHRVAMIKKADIAFLCLPDESSRELVGAIRAQVDKPGGIVIDTSTAHRTALDFAYGFPELDYKFRNAIQNAKRIAIPGCHASGAVALLYPLLKERVLAPEAPVAITSITGYSGGGKAMIAQYQASDRDPALALPRPYAVGQTHKHLAEIMEICGLRRPPVLQPIVCDFYSGMLVGIPLIREWFDNIGAAGAQGGVNFLTNLYRDHYAGQNLISVLAPNREAYVNPCALTGLDNMQIFVTGNDERMIAYARFDNLGKGSSGAAVQCMNLRLGIPEETGLVWREMRDVNKEVNSTRKEV